MSDILNLNEAPKSVRDRMDELLVDPEVKGKFSKFAKILYSDGDPIHAPFIKDARLNSLDRFLSENISEIEPSDSYYQVLHDSLFLYKAVENWATPHGYTPEDVLLIKRSVASMVYLAREFDDPELIAGGLFAVHAHLTTNLSNKGILNTDPGDRFITHLKDYVIYNLKADNVFDEKSPPPTTIG